MHSPTSVLENDTHKLHWDLDIKTDHIISTGRQDIIIIINKKNENLQNCGYCCLDWPERKSNVSAPADHRVKVTFIPIVIGALGTITEDYEGTGGLGNKRTSEDHLNYCIIEIGQIIEMSPDYNCNLRTQNYLRG